jgi:hypothetical protein
MRITDCPLSGRREREAEISTKHIGEIDHHSARRRPTNGETFAAMVLVEKYAGR